MPDDPRLERALEELFTPSACPAARFVGRAGSAGLARRPLDLLAACGGDRGHGDKSDEQAEEEGRRPSTTRRRRSATGPSPTGRSTSTSRSSRTSTSKYGGKCKYVEEINDNYEFFGKVRQQLEQGRRSAATSSRRPTTWPPAWSASTTSSRSTRSNIPNAKNLVDNLKSINYDPKRNYSLPWQSGGDRPRLQHQEDGPRAQERQGPLRPEVQGPRHDALRALRLGQHRAARRGRRRLQGDDRRDPRGDREDRQGQPRRPDPPLHRQRLHDRPREGQRVGLARLLGRPHPAPGRQPRPAVRLPRGGRDALHGQHDDAGQGRAPVRGRDDDELRLRARGGGARSRVRQLHHARSRACRSSSPRPTRSSPTTS